MISVAWFVFLVVRVDELFSSVCGGWWYRNCSVNPRGYHPHLPSHPWQTFSICWNAVAWTCGKAGLKFVLDDWNMLSVSLNQSSCIVGDPVLCGTFCILYDKNPDLHCIEVSVSVYVFPCVCVNALSNRPSGKPMQRTCQDCNDVHFLFQNYLHDLQTIP